MRKLEENKRVEDEGKRQVEKTRIEVSFFCYLVNNCKAMVKFTLIFSLILYLLDSFIRRELT